MATRRGRTAATAADEMSAPAPVTKGRVKKEVVGDEHDVPVPAAVAKAVAPVAKGRKAALNEKSVNVAPKVNIEDELAALSAKLQEVTLEKEKNEVLLKEKDAIIQQKAEDNAKLKKEVLKLQKVKTFEPELNPAVLKTIAQKDAPTSTDAESGATPDDVPAAKEKSKDPRKPKHPPSAYHMWNADNYQKMKNERPDASLADMSKYMSEKWKTVSDKVKQAYERKYTQEMAVYKEAMASYEKMLAEEKLKEEALLKLQEKRRQEEALKLFDQYLLHNKEVQGMEDAKQSKKKAKDPEKPKQPTSAYLFYCKERRLEKSGDDIKRSAAEETKILSEEWNKLKEKKNGTAKYDKLAAADQARYATEMEAYKAKKQQEEEAEKAELEKKNQEDLELAMSLMDSETATLQPVPSLQAASSVSGKAGKEKVKRGPSGYNLFCAATREEVNKKMPNLPFGEMSKILGQAWTALSEEEKSVWIAKAQAASISAPSAGGVSDEFGI